MLWSTRHLTIYLLFVCVVSTQKVFNVDNISQDYIIAEKNLWRLIHSTSYDNRLETLNHIYVTHVEQFEKVSGVYGIFEQFLSDQSQDEISAEKRSLIDSVMDINATALNIYRILDHKNYETLPHLVDDILENTRQSMALISKAIDRDFWTWTLQNSQICQPGVTIALSETQIIMEFYKEMVLSLLKGYMLLQVSFMWSTVTNQTDMRQQAESEREHWIYNVSVIQDAARQEARVANKSMWACDPDNFYYSGTFIEITNFYQGYVDNEANLNAEDNCKSSCEDYTRTVHHKCVNGSFCAPEQPHLLEPPEILDRIQTKAICRGNVHNCRTLDGDLKMCLAEEYSARRYEYIESTRDGRFGKRVDCYDVAQSPSWLRWFVYCSNCFCYCDEPGPSSTRHFSLRAVVSNVNENKIITGIRFVDVNHIIQFEVVESILLPNGQILSDKANEIKWKAASLFRVNDGEAVEGVDYHTITWTNRSFDLDTVFDVQRVVTGVRFRVIDAHVRLEVRFTDFDYQSGELRNVRHSEWVGSSHGIKKLLKPNRPDRPTRSPRKSMPIKGEHFYVQFHPSDIRKDAAQSTVPFIDSQPIEASTPISGVGLHLKTQFGYGGFIAPKLIVFDSGLYITPINDF